MLRDETQPGWVTGFVRQHDIEEYRIESHHIGPNVEIDMHHIGTERLRRAPHISPKLRWVREDGGDDHCKTIIARRREVLVRALRPAQ